ncbi:MAG: hypothetical protein KDA87_05465 [Planctomycetales bacterium]|nr:hypothetical protein [Planctomycetales bacterium]
MSIHCVSNKKLKLWDFGWAEFREFRVDSIGCAKEFFTELLSLDCYDDGFDSSHGTDSGRKIHGPYHLSSLSSESFQPVSIREFQRVIDDLISDDEPPSSAQLNGLNMFLHAMLSGKGTIYQLAVNDNSAIIDLPVHVIFLEFIYLDLMARYANILTIGYD